MSNLVFPHMIKLFPANELVLNLDKQSTIKSINNNSPHNALITGNKEKEW
jgi:hypothetical protein